MEEQTQTTRSSHAEAGHEPVTVSARVLLVSAAGLALLIIVSLAVTWGYARVLGRRTTGIEADDAPEITAPRKTGTLLEPDQRAQRLAYERKQRALLDGYEWNSEKRESARIPIERAMQLVEQRYQSQKADKKNSKP